ncbi:MAG TPA: sulfite oxidase [Nitrospira sp.]|nr:sulfite oxidase [Nitrospira sp.]HNA27341.1 sulfite oxidase [Nitrospira sp.]HNI69289.1 sulfite oxidase [Nitrospira sp.]HNL89824.1 sulfite oxidase [Nitrospira sp.]HNN42821.1 sulfite oxidase [Nitrospira sp.]
MTVARRGLLSLLLQGIGIGLFVKGTAQAADGNQAEATGQGSGPLTVRVSRPFDAETPVREFASWLTPNERFFVRSHFGPPPAEAVQPDTWRLTVKGLVKDGLTLSLKDLHEFEPVTVTSVLQCSGNGRANHRPKVPGVQWERGAVGNAQWTGVRLRDVLQRAGVKPQGLHVQMQGADRPALPTVPLFTRSIPIAKALHPDTLLAYEMNGRPLPLLHGAPLRVITPGWMAESCMKWLTEITVRADETPGYYMQQAYRIPETSIQPGSGLPGTVMVPVEQMPVKSLIAAPGEGDTVRKGPLTIQGVAWAGESAVTQVEVSCDDGKTWEPARLLGEAQPYAWRQWQYVWNPKTLGPTAILCRAMDARGEQQPATSSWNPGGFLWSGWDRVAVTVSA